MDIESANQISQDLAEIKATQGRNDKEALAADKFVTTAHKEFLDMVGNSNRQWFTTWASVIESKPVCGEEWDDIWYAAEGRISTPSVTASRIKGLLAEGYPENFLKAIVEKTPDIGITISSIKKSLGDTKKFGPALAADWLDMGDKKRDKLLTENNYVSTPKMDGLRCLFFCNLPSIDGAFSRALKPLKNLNKHHQEILRIVGNTPCVIDGEILSADNTWENSVTAVKKTGSLIKSMHYSFDYIPGSEFLSGKFTTSAFARFDLLDKIMSQIDQNMFQAVHRIPVKTIKDVIKEHDMCVEEGWEGTVLHNLSAPYSCKRANSWVKVKSFKSSEFTVESFVGGTGKHRGRLGAFMISGEYGNVKVRSEVGTGFTDAQRQDIWDNQKSWVGATVEIKFFNLTPDGSLRFPSYLRRRDIEN